MAHYKIISFLLSFPGNALEGSMSWQSTNIRIFSFSSFETFHRVSYKLFGDMHIFPLDSCNYTMFHYDCGSGVCA